ncbi:coiled-coil domain-containing protein 91-like [Ptychodera flava]|uniref:coiled-coil domain-containing protein 91-like n=1 Tax=Ptychodera flava TaxID=63121 RepID=UPI00396AA069
MAVNWANFPPSETENTAPGNDNDDWAMDDDFGGFEAAEPIPPEIAEQAAQASPSPWAVFPPMVASPGQPDLLQAQSQPQQAKAGLDNPFLEDGISNSQPEITSNLQANPPEVASQVQTLPQPEITASMPGATAAAQPEITSAGKVRNTPPPEITAQAALSSVQSLQNSTLNLEDFRLSDDDDDDLPTFKVGAAVDGANRRGKDKDGLENVEVSNKPLSTQNDVHQDRKEGSTAKSRQNQSQSAVKQEEDREKTALKEQLSEMTEKLSTAEKERLRLQKDLQDLLEKSKTLESEVKEHTLAADEQKRKYEEMQEKQSKELDEIRKAGHDALAIIVEEYKELCKVAVIQQQEASEKHLQTAIQTETETSKTMLRAQHERLMKVVEEERAQGETRLKEALAEQQELSQKLTQKCVEEERQKAQEAIQKAIEEANKSHQSQLEKILQEERDKTKQLLEEERNRGVQLLEEERGRSQDMLQKCLEEEKQRSREAIKNALQEERGRQEAAIKQVTIKCREDMVQYIQERKRADSTLRQRSMASMDLFLESARQQLKLLMQDNLGDHRESDDELPK